METKEPQTVARRAATLDALNESDESHAPATDQAGGGGRRKDEITLRVPNPLLSRKEDPPALAAPAPDPGSPHSAPTAKLKVSSLVWNEYNSMPLTPAPVAAGQAQNLAGSPHVDLRPKSRRTLMFVLVVLIIGAGVIAGVLIPREKTASHVAPPSESELKDPVPGTAEKPSEAAKSPAVTAPAPSEPAKQPDVNPRVSLKKAAVPVGHPKTRTAEPAARMSESEPKYVKPRVEPVEDFGMDMKRPAAGRQTKKMDEKDPYAP